MSFWRRHYIAQCYIALDIAPFFSQSVKHHVVVSDFLPLIIFRYPDRKALYLLGQTSNDTTTQKWLNKLISRREQRNLQFLERLKQKQDQSSHQQKLNISSFNTRPINSRSSVRQNSLAPHRLLQNSQGYNGNYHTSVYTSHSPGYRTSRLPPTSGHNYSPTYIPPGTPKTARTARRPGHIDTSEVYLSSSTGKGHRLSTQHEPRYQRKKPAKICKIDGENVKIVQYLRYNFQSYKIKPSQA